MVGTDGDAGETEGDEVGLPVGSQVPDVSETLVYPDGETEERRLADLYAEKPVLLVFYTNDFTPDCIEEWCSFRDYAWFTANDDIRVVGSSKSRPSTHRRFIDHLDLDFPLFSDTDLAISDAFDVSYRVLGLVPRSRRSCFFIDTDGTVRYKWVGEHPLDPTRDQPPLDELHENITGLL